MSSRLPDPGSPGGLLPDGRHLRAGVFLYLASKSPRRQELLRQLGIVFHVFLMREGAGRYSDVDEAIRAGESPEDYVKRVAEAKAATGWLRMRERRLPEHPMLGADTTVVVDGELLGKPADVAEAESMLRALAGRQHDVLTAVAIAWQERIVVAVSRSTVTFRPLAAAEIERYVTSGEPFDKAGGYAIQGRAGAFVTRLDGSYSGVMGLPLAETVDLLARLGFLVL